MALGATVLPQGPVVEHLRVKVPADARRAWLQAEEASWGPWLRRQDGFLGRDLLWDAEREEGLLLIRWRSRRQWLAIPASEIETVQGRFEAAARRALAHDPEARGPAGAANPFPLVHAGELEWLALTPPVEEEGR
ncbi:TIGR03792 family protein [Cyanobium gracile UHCC 0139]|uniref:TIGR03792 family protein n=2 Tax=Cyanobium gracile TaxID=59930 RepID=A0ABU5RV32_9CYAN|nr:TIGR03792 family protein [Cyanobium gracile]MEA5391602.1 TIGR03792 family protein [Cyanobium gracile UHCC 0139]